MIDNTNEGLQAAMEMVEIALKNARGMAKIALSLAESNLESLDRELKLAKDLCLSDQTISNIQERLTIAEDELLPAQRVMFEIKKAHINLKTNLVISEFSTPAQ